MKAIILASPVYFGSATALIKAFMERIGYIGGRRVFDGKVDGPLVVPAVPGRTLPSLSSCFGFTLWASLCLAQPTGISPLVGKRGKLRGMRRG